MTTSRMRRAIAALALVAVAGVTVAACSDNDSSDASAREMSEDPATNPTVTDDNRQSDMADEPATNTIVDIAASNPDFSTLVAAVQAAGLAETLSGPGPFTVFAPTNEAFAKLPAGTVESLLDPANKDKLTSILTYHVVPGEVLAADVAAGNVTTVNGSTFSVSTNGGVLISDGQGGTAKVVRTDIAASNGVIHVIDAVLLPPS